MTTNAERIEHFNDIIQAAKNLRLAAILLKMNRITKELRKVRGDKK